MPESTKPLTREEIAALLDFAESGRSTTDEAEAIRRWVATSDDRADDLRAAMCLAMADLQQFGDIRGAVLRLSDAIAADDARRSA